MPHIQVLDQITIDKIAAGEVIERPASIVKELVENAVDAGASSVVVEIQEGGISLIRVMDDGCGIAREDVQNAFLRHSTSKIRSVEDLSHISSLGFRGEALSSIAAVTKVELLTKTREESVGTRYLIEGGKEIKLEDTGAKDGTTFLIRQLFYNVPARRKFLKTAMTEAGHIQDLLMRLALSHPEVAIRFINNGQEKMRTSGSGKLKDVIYSIYGRESAANLIEMNYGRNGILITGYLGKPSISRGNRNFENLFVNGRYVKSAMISKAVEDAYRDYVMQHKFPFVVLHFQIDGEEIDVNVHPTKMELRFQRQQEVYNLVYEGVHRTLLEPELIPIVSVPEPKKPESKMPAPKVTGEGEMGGSPFLLKPRAKTEQSGTLLRQPETAGLMGRTEVQPGTNAEQPEVHDEEYFLRKMKERVLAYHNRTVVEEEAGESTDLSGHRAEERRENVSGNREESPAAVEKREKSISAEQKMYGYSANGQNDLSLSADGNKAPSIVREAGNYQSDVQTVLDTKGEQLDLFQENFLKREIRAEYRLIGQIFETYWLVEFQDSLYIIDQHAAHERVLYERTLREMKNREFTSQYISPPIILSLSMQEARLLEENMERFTRIGFEIEHFGGEEYAVRAVPDNLFSIAKKELLMEMLDSLSENVSSNMTPELIDEKVASLSCKAAVKGNNRLSATEMDTLIGELLLLDNPYHCPHGRPTIIAMTKKELEKKFKRIV